MMLTFSADTETPPRALIGLRKRNHVLATSYYLKLFAHMRLTDQWDQFLKLLPFQSSEDLEVFHSLMRAATQNHDSLT